MTIYHHAEKKISGCFLLIKTCNIERYYHKYKYESLILKQAQYWVTNNIIIYDVNVQSAHNEVIFGTQAPLACAAPWCLALWDVLKCKAL